MKKGLLLGSLLVSSISFSQVLVNEGFEGGLPGTWSQITAATDGGWLNGTGTQLSSSSFPIPNHDNKMMATNDDGCNCNKNLDRLVSQTIDLTGQTSVMLSTDIFFAGGTYQGATEVGTVEASGDGGTTWTVLETLAGEGDWRTETFDLSSYAGNANVKVSFKYSDAGGWLFGMAIDNFKVYIPAANDAKVNTVSLARYAQTGVNTPLVVNVQNVGSNAITSITMDWNDGASHSQTIAVNIPVNGSANVTHPTNLNYATAVERTINVSITQVNAMADGEPSDNNGSALHNTVSQIVQKNVVIEEGTGTWCGWCPRGAIAMDYMTATYPNQFIGIAVHNGDPMTVTAYDNGANLSGYPGCNVDRALLDQGVSQASFVSYYNARKDLVVPASLSVGVSGSASNVVLDVDANFVTTFSAANYRLGVVIVENGVTGTSSGYNQTNYYAGGANGPMGGYESLPATVPAAQMVYDHVGRALLGGYAGQPSSVPTVIADGSTASYTFNYSVPATSNILNMHAVAVLIDQATGEIVNAEEVSLAVLSISETETIEMNVFPNPATDNMTVTFEAEAGDYTISMTDLAGRTVLSNTYTNLVGSQNINLDVQSLLSGNYLVTIATNGASYTKMINKK